MVDIKEFQLVKSAWSPAGNVTEEVSCGKSSPDNRFPDAVVGDSRIPVARLCSAVGSELMKFDSSVPIEQPPASRWRWLTAAALVVCGGSVNGVSCEALADAPA